MAQLIVALDYTNAEDALATAESLRGCPIWMKVGLELFTHCLLYTSDAADE